MRADSGGRSSKLKSAALGLGAMLALVLVSMFAITSREAIPDRAAFLVNVEERYVVPKPLPGQFIFHPIPGAEDEVLGRFDGTVTWGELRRKDHPYHDFDLPSTPEWDRFMFIGEEITLFRSIFFPPPSRWDEQGQWRY